MSANGMRGPNGIRGLLRKADEAAGEPAFGRISATQVRRRVRQRRFLMAVVPTTAAAAALLTTGLWVIYTGGWKPGHQPQRIVSLEEQIRQLQTQTQSTLNIVQEVLEKDRQQRRLNALEAELARIPKPGQKIDQQVDNTALLLLSRADRLRKEAGRTDAAIETYRYIIEHYPESRWADEARKRLSEIREQRINKSDGKGALRCDIRRA